MAHSLSASSMAGSDGTNPFADASCNPIAPATIHNVNIRAHVPLLLDYGDPTFKIWTAFYDAVFRKFGIIDHIDGSIDAQAM